MEQVLIATVADHAYLALLSIGLGCACKLSVEFVMLVSHVGEVLLAFGKLLVV